MNEISISSAISKLHSTILSIFFFILLTLSLGFISLLYGIKIDNLEIAHLDIKKLYIKWDKKLVVKAQQIKITTNTQTSSIHYKKRLKTLFYFLKNVDDLSDLIEEINIKRIAVNDTDTSFSYKMNESGDLHFSSKNLHLDCKITIDKELSYITIQTPQMSNVKLNGNIIINSDKETLASKVDANIYDDANVTLYLYSNKKNIFYTLDSKNNISHIKKIVKLFALPQYLDRWIYDAVAMKDATINKAYGYLDLSKPKEMMQNIYVDADLQELHYTFDKRLAPLDSAYTNIVFKNGVFHIYPKDANYKQQKLQNSYLDIDLNTNLLTIYLKDRLSLDADLLYLLKTYNVNLPFMQTSSTADTTLNIAIQLNNSKTDVNGRFSIDDADFLYSGIDLHVKNALLLLHNSQVDISNLTLSYKDNIVSEITGDLNPSKHTGRLDIALKKVDFPSQSIALDTNTSKVNVVYRASPDGDALDVSKSFWNYSGNTLAVQAFESKFDFAKLHSTLSAVEVSLNNNISAYLSGDVELGSLTADLQLDILKLQYGSFRLDQTILPISLSYNKDLKANIASKSVWKLGNRDIVIEPAKFMLNQNYFRLVNTGLSIKDTLDSDFYLAYDMNKKTGYLSLENIQPKNDFLTHFFRHEDTSLYLKIDTNSSATKIYADKYALEFDLRPDDGWALKCDDLGKISEQVSYLNDFNITKGNLNLFSDNAQEGYRFNGKISSDYTLLVKNNVPVNDYYFNGNYTPDGTTLNINNYVQASIKKDIKITAKNVGFDIPQIIKFNDNYNLKKENSKTSPVITLDANNTYLYLTKDRRMLADSLNMQYLNSQVTAQLKYKKGTAGFNLNSYGIFYLYGSGFDDRFMDALFAHSKFQNGDLSFTINGAFDNFSGIIEVKNTILKDYAVLNNVFAFINTIPSLVTFSLPDYSEDGLKVENMYAGFTAKKGVFDLSDISLNSKEIKISGKGTMDLKKELVDLNLNLKTDLGSTVSKIPLVGYILFDKDSISTSLKVTGSLNDPKVSTTLAKDIIIAPLNIIKRTLLLPIEIFSPSDK